MYVPIRQPTSGNRQSVLEPKNAEEVGKANRKRKLRKTEDETNREDTRQE